MIQVYTGNGKGKTTAALGLTLRAAGCGLKVYIAQFCKGRQTSELNTLKKIKNIKIEQFGSCCFITKTPTQKDISLARQGLIKVEEAIKSKAYDMIIMDEANLAIKLNLIRLKDILTAIKKIPDSTELILTGRDAHPKIVEIADLVSEVKEKKHYYNKGIKARKGIEE